MDNYVSKPGRYTNDHTVLAGIVFYLLTQIQLKQIQTKAVKTLVQICSDLLIRQYLTVDCLIDRKTFSISIHPPKLLSTNIFITYLHLVFVGVVLDWGHGWGWTTTTQTPAIVPQISLATEAFSSSFYCHTADDYTMTGLDDFDWSAFGDFCF